MQVKPRPAYLTNMAGRAVLTTSELMRWTHAMALHRGKRSRCDRLNHCRAIRRAAERLCIRAGRSAGHGRPILWRLRDSDVLKSPSKSD